MRIATYNVWNENKGTRDRIGQILDEIRKVSADLIALQEITPVTYTLYFTLPNSTSHAR